MVLWWFSEHHVPIGLCYHPFFRNLTAAKLRNLLKLSHGYMKNHLFSSQNSPFLHFSTDRFVCSLPCAPPASSTWNKRVSMVIMSVFPHERRQNLRKSGFWCKDVGDCRATLNKQVMTLKVIFLTSFWRCLEEENRDFLRDYLIYVLYIVIFGTKKS